MPKDRYRYISQSGPVVVRADPRYGKKIRSDPNKDNRVVATVVGSYICIMLQTHVLGYGNTVMPFHPVLCTYEYPLPCFNRTLLFVFKKA